MSVLDWFISQAKKKRRIKKSSMRVMVGYINQTNLERYQDHGDERKRVYGRSLNVV